ncbi:MAG: hypothetical protein V5B35_03045 [Candidatus Accumulibacter necessarius]|uniref:polysaccharide lyase n=1 Tax=Candidatus Accumulibacter necessarius TaxID=2954386 RepID=UPI002FC2D90C
MNAFPALGRFSQMTLRILSCAALVLAVAIVHAATSGHELAPGQEIVERKALYEGEGGASCSHFLGDVLAWQRVGGDWRDARGKLFGDQPYAEAAPGPSGASWDVTPLMRKWGDASVRRGTFAVRSVAGSGFATFHSREAKSSADWPTLVLELAGGRRETLKPTADAHLDCSTYKALGRANILQIMGSRLVLLQFQIPTTASGRNLVRAQLVLSSPTPPGGGALRIGIFEMETPSFPASPVRDGLAAGYAADKGIEHSPDVVFAAGFDEWLGWRSRWAKDSAGEFDVVKEDSARYFEPLVGKALRVNLKKGSNYGADLRLYLRELGGEVDELFFRYYLRLADDWDPKVDGGKLPGLAGTYGKAGWGGRRSDGTNGWALRGAFLKAFPSDHPMQGLTQLATYAYHADMKTNYGDFWIWPGALLQRNRWYCIEQQVRLNRPGMADGELRVWVDGRLVVERQNIRLRNVDQLRIETVWLDVYHGGVARSPYDQHLYVDNVVVARRYIGPMMQNSISSNNAASK